MKKKIKAKQKRFHIDTPKIHVNGWMTFTKLKKLYQKAYGKEVGMEAARHMWKNRYVTK